jgi:hypothetical protein
MPRLAAVVLLALLTGAPAAGGAPSAPPPRTLQIGVVGYSVFPPTPPGTPGWNIGYRAYVYFGDPPDCSPEEGCSLGCDRESCPVGSATLPLNHLKVTIQVKAPLSLIVGVPAELDRHFKLVHHRKWTYTPTAPTPGLLAFPVISFRHPKSGTKGCFVVAATAEGMPDLKQRFCTAFRGRSHHHGLMKGTPA